MESEVEDNSHLRRHAYTYDDLNRLIQATGKAKSARYTLGMEYDLMGNPDLNKKGDDARTVTISQHDNDRNGNHEIDVNPANAINGVGSDAIVVFDAVQNISQIPTKDPNTGNVSPQSLPYELALGHELVHADRSMKGVAVDYSMNTTHTYKDANGNTVTQSRPKEDMETVGLHGHYKYSENKLRKEQGLNERGAY
ncbi:hypothetical protein FACS189430_11780 [Bacteroidia bacterium]|nr:hypothetical protein FACS189430_11780 [Bacteroidia bacterium]